MPIDCEHIRNEFSALLDNELNVEDRELIEEHLSDCSTCLRELHGYKQVSEAYRYHHPVKAPDDFEERLRKALEPAGRSRARAPWPFYGVAAAAAVILVAGLTLWRGQQPLTESLLLSQAGSAAPPEAAVGMRAERAAASDAAAPPENRAFFDAQPDAGPSADPDPVGPLALSLEAPVAMKSAPGTPPAAAPPDEAAIESSAETDAANTDPSRPMPEAPPEGDTTAGRAMAETPAPPADATDSSESETTSRAAEPPVEAVASAPATDVFQRQQAEEAAAPARAGVTAAKDSGGIADVGAAPLEVITWRERTFRHAGGLWRESGYAGERRTRIAIPSTAWNALLDTHPDLNKLVEAAAPVVVRLDKTWYEFRRAETPPEDTPDQGR